MKKKMAYSLLLSDDNLVYLIGGKDSYDSLAAKGYVQAYDNRSPTWLTLSPTNHKTYGRFSSAGCAANGFIYISSDSEQIIEIFDPAAGKWRIVDTSLMIGPDNWFCIPKMVLYKNHLFYFDLNMHQFGIYSLKTEEWSPLMSLAKCGIENFRTDTRYVIVFNSV